MSRSGAPFLVENISTSIEENANVVIPELFFQPPTPRLEPSESIDIPWQASRRHLSVDFNMHGSRSANCMDGIENTLTREKRSQSVPLSLDAVTFSRRVVTMSDKFEARHHAVQIRMKERSRTLSDSEPHHGSLPTRLPNRHSDIIEHWLRESDSFSPKIGSPV